MKQSILMDDGTVVDLQINKKLIKEQAKRLGLSYKEMKRRMRKAEREWNQARSMESEN